MLETCGIVKIDGVIELPDHMVGNIDPETLCVQLTPIGVFQELFVDRIEYGPRIILRNGAGGPINAYYHVHAVSKLTVTTLSASSFDDLTIDANPRPEEEIADDHAHFRTTDI